MTPPGAVAMLIGQTRDGRRLYLTAFILGDDAMAEMLQQGSRFPQLDLTLLDGGTLALPGGAPSRYTALLFYRGHW